MQLALKYNTEYDSVTLFQSQSIHILVIVFIVLNNTIDVDVYYLLR